MFAQRTEGVFLRAWGRGGKKGEQRKKCAAVYPHQGGGDWSFSKLVHKKGKLREEAPVLSLLIGTEQHLKSEQRGASGKPVPPRKTDSSAKKRGQTEKGENHDEFLLGLGGKNDVRLILSREGG